MLISSTQQQQQLKMETNQVPIGTSIPGAQANRTTNLNRTTGKTTEKQKQKQENQPKTPEEFRKAYFFLAKLAKQVGRYDDMLQFVGKMISYSALGRKDMGGELTENQRNFVCVALKLAIDQKRELLRVLESIPDKHQSTQTLKSKIMSEIAKISYNFIGQFRDKSRGERDGNDDFFNDNQDMFVVTTIQDQQIKAQYCKLIADHHRYILKYDENLGQKYSQFVSRCQKRYKTGMQAMKSQKIPTNQIKLGLILNYSVFLYQFRKNTEQAYKLSKKACDDFQNYLANQFDTKVPDATLKIIDMLRRNCSVWEQ